MKKYLIGLGFLLLAYVAYLAQDAIIILAYVVSVILALFLFTAFFIGVWYIFERMMTIRATRIERQKQAEVMVIDTSDGTFIRDTNPKAGYLALHLQQVLYNMNNEILSIPSTIEAQAWQVHNGPKQITNPVLALPETVEDVKLLPQIVDRLKSSYQILIAGPTGSGKTTLCQHYLYWLSRQGYSIVPCDIHSPGTMFGFDVVGSGRKFKDIFNALDVIIGIMDQRYNHPDYGKSDYNPKMIAVFIDELTVLVKEAKKLNFDLSDALETLLTEGRKVNIKMILSIHSLDVKTLGLTVGIRESNTMVKLYGEKGGPYECYIVPPLASIISKKDWIEYLPPGEFEDELEPRKFITKMPDARTIKIKNLAKQGFKPTPIAAHINRVRKPNGRQINEVKEVLGITT